MSKRKSRKGKRRDGARRAEPAAAANAQGTWQEAALVLNPDDDELRSNLAQLEASLSGTR